LTAALPPHPAYKDSGVPWLGRIPAHWEVNRQRNVVDMLVSNIDKHTVEGQAPVRLCNYVDVYKNDRVTERLPFMRATASADEIERFRLRVGDVIITKDSEAWNDIGVPALVEYSAPDLVCGYHLAILRPRGGISGDYLLRAIQSQGVATQYHVSANGVTRYGLSHDAIKSVVLPIPPPDEQYAITRYLDHVDRRIRRYIRARQKLIALLEEQKQAVIHQAVTGQIDVRTGRPYPAYKSSGVDWLGDVPEHWEVKRNGLLFAQRNETGYAELPILEVSLRTGVNVRDFSDSTRKQVMSDRGSYKRAVQGDLAYNMMRMWQGAVGLAPVDGLISPAYVVARPLGGIDPRYYVSLFRTAIYMGEVDKYSSGIVKDRNRLYWEGFKQMPSPHPPPTEQAQIAAAIQQQTQAVDIAIGQTVREIALLREYRTRLLADVVTGQVDVCAAAAQLPEEAEELDALDETEEMETAEDDEEAMAGQPEEET
jgi:type I restriction enzyme S subunit